MRVECSVHGSKAGSETNTDNQPRVRGHQPITPATGVQSPSRQTNDTDTQSGVHESLVEVFSFVRGHTAIFARFPVEDQVRGKDCTTHQSGAVEKSLCQIAAGSCARRLIGRSLVTSLETIAESFGLEQGLCARRRRRRRPGSEE